MYIIAGKMINDCKFDFNNFGILTLQITIVSFDMQEAGFSWYEAWYNWCTHLRG